MAAAKKTNGHDPVTKQMVDVLERIEKELHELRNEVREVRKEAHEDLTLLRVEMQTGFREVHHVIADVGSHHEARIAKLEEAVFKRTG